MRRKSRGVRYAEVEHATDACRVQVVLDFDGGTKSDVLTKIPAFDKLLTTFAIHALVDIGVTVEAEGEVSSEGVIEAVGTALGMAVGQALEADVSRHSFDSATCAVGSVLVAGSVDLGERANCRLDLGFSDSAVSGVPTAALVEFFEQFSRGANLNLSLSRTAGESDYHCSIAAFKCLGRCLRDALDSGLSRNP